MNRVAGIIVAALGLVVALLSIAKILPGITSTGVVMILFGGLIIGLSFIDKPDSEGVERMSTPSTLGNIFFAPSEVFRNLRRHPRWLVALLLISVLSATYTNLFVERLGAERVANFTIDKTLDMSLIANNEEARKGVEASRPQAIADMKNPLNRAAQVVSGFAASAFGFVILALIFFLFTLVMGGKINFWQAFAGAIYAYLPISIIRFVLNTVILHVKDPADIHPILGQQTLVQDNLNFLVASADNPVLYTILGAFSLLGFYWVFMNAISIKFAGENTTGTIGWTTAISIFVILLFLGIGMAALFPGFIS